MTADMISEFIVVIYEWIRLFFHAGVYPYWGSLLYFFIFMVIWGSSGFIAATIAEMKGHSVLLHFGGGLLLPVVYPVAIIFILEERFGENAPQSGFDRQAANIDMTSFEMTEKIIQNRINKKLEKLGVHADSEEGKAIIAQEKELFNAHNADVTEVPVPEESKAPEEVVDETKQPEEGDIPIEMNKAYFDSIAVDQTGQRGGPFNLELKNAKILVAQAIVGTNDDLAIFEISDHHAKAKRLRIKYENIVSCVKREE